MKQRLIIAFSIVTLLTFVIGGWLAGTMLSAPAPQFIGNLPTDLLGDSVEFPSESGTIIQGWLIPGKKGRGAVVLMHGVRSNRLSMVDRARFLSQAGYTVLLFDFQSHGESTGQHISFGYLESRDAQAAVKFLRTNVADEKVGLIGISMGGAAALVASPPLEVRAMVLEMVYPTINQAISNRLTMRFGAWSSILTPFVLWQFKPRLGVDAEVLRPIEQVGKIGLPKLFIVGAEDQHTTLEETRQMYVRASAPKDLWVVNGAGHIDLHSMAKEEYEQRILSFFEQHLR